MRVWAWVGVIVFVAGCGRGDSLPPLVDGDGAQRIPGKFVWHNLITDDADAARVFYGELFGWEFELKEGSRYSVIRHEGRNIGGILDTSKDRGKRVARAHWLSAMSVPNLESSLQAVKSAGGKQLEAPIDVAGVGRVVTVEDSVGAMFHLLASERGDPPDVEPPVHTWLWHELLADETARALAFYESAFGYATKPLKKKPDSGYRVLWSIGQPRAGIIENPFDGTPSAWIPYIRVEDPAALAARVPELGGRVVLKPEPQIRNGTLAVVVDPSGAPLALQQWSPDQEVSQ